jgi:hypothetical protein
MLRVKKFFTYLVKVKVTPDKQQKAQRGSRGIPLFVLNLGARCGWAVKAALRALYSRRQRPTLPTVEGAERAPEPV